MKIKTLGLFCADPDNEVNPGMFFAQYIFELDDVSAINETENGTDIEFRSGVRQSVAIPFDEFRKLFHDMTEIVDPKSLYEYKEQK
jgi:hypothetical protein